MNKKIFIPIGSFYPNQKNGPSLSLYWLSKFLTEESHDVTIYTTNDGVVDLKSDELLILDYGKVKYTDLGYFNFPIKLIFECITAFHKYDIIIITSIFYPVSAILIFFSFFFNKKVIISPRGELFDNSINSSKKQLKLFYIHVFNYFLRHRVKNYLFHSTSKQEQETVKDFFSNKVENIIIPNFIYMPIRQNKTYARKYVLFLGRIHSDKALDKLIDAFYLIRSKFDNSQIKLVLTGGIDSKYAIDLIYYIKVKGLDQYIDFVGFIEGKEKSQLITDALCTVLISNSENFGNSVLESLCFGTPVITSTGTPWSEVIEKNCGFWIDNTPELIADKIITLKTIDLNEYKLMCDNARSYAENNFSIQKNKGIWLNLFNRL